MQPALGEVLPFQQTTDWSCGPASLKAVLQHWGERTSEQALIYEVGARADYGSTAQQVADAARARGYTAREQQFDSIDELKAYTDQDVPVIVAVQSFNRPGQGHFVVATDVTDSTVELMDPNTPGNHRVISRREMAKRWKFRDQVGVVVMPREKAAQFRGANLEGWSDFTRNQKIGMGIMIGGVITLIVTTGVWSMRKANRR